MALSSWKTFDFFEVSQVKPSDDESKSFFENNEISCVCSGSDSLFLGSYDGFVRILSPTFKVLRTFQAHDTGSITHMKQVEGTSLLVTISEDISNEPVLKVWALDKPVKKTGLPTCQSTLSIQNGRKPFPISAFTALDDLSQLAIGFANGSVTVVRGDLVHDRGAKQRTVHESEEPITGVEFREESRLTTLYVSTTSRILKLVIAGRGQGQAARAVEDSGCAVGCMTLDKRMGDIIVVRDDAIYYYGVDGRGPCYAIDGPKSLVAIYEDYVALVSPPSSSTPAKTNTLRRFGGAQADELFNTSTFTLLDTVLKFVAHSESLVSQVKTLFMIWGDLFTLTQDGKIYRYHEKSLQQRLEILYQRNLFVTAINLAQRSGMDASGQNVIFRKYGDHLYQKADYDGAMQQYLKAIDNTEPSQVIRKFLDTQRIHNLIEYLEELHEHHKATADHTTLLLNCYAKLKDIDKLEKFIKSPGDLKFDLDTAISMCRQGGYYEQAAYLATKHGEHELVVDILIEDSKKYADALDFISRLEPEAAYSNMMKYARVLLEHCPKETTQLFVHYFTGHYQPKVDVVVPQEVVAQQPGYAAGAVNAVQNLKDLLPLPYMNTSAVASPPTQGNVIPTVSDNQVVSNPEQNVVPQYSPPQPRTAFSSFVDHPDEFVVFLEACLQEKDLKERDKIDLYTTLFEMYLHKANEKKGANREEWEAKAKKLIEGKDIPIDTSNVLLLSHLSDFRDGTILVREQAGLRFDIFRSYTSAKDTRGAIKALRKYGPEEPQLYPAALAYFTSDPRILDEAGDELDAVLQKIDEDGLMAPLQVIQTLSTNAVATMGMVKTYLQQTIERERKEIASNRRLITSYRTETSDKRQEIADLSNKPQTFNNTRCASCSSPLYLPTVHFLCKHSFHRHCLNMEVDEDGNVEGPCPNCRKDNDTIRAIRKAQDESADRHDIFLAALAGSRDKFGTISEFYGRGVMEIPSME
ncbi:vacuolar protein sorting protein-like protein [Mollisia scopiformis]|uniref:E3 ubiquitin-protein ligase PEP5 n=1 Tax=Mollisia scopiformis TaxID=149040 RepID=A0A194WXC3_MOLSC|nr:vacuolar protein sorting protein-like protein [Mollisia scopiformis]KUJ12242.1 vacuolar protein sorting protein-like protein [Mollisia scopiformis]